MSVAASVRDSASFLTSLWKNQVVVYETSRVFQPWAPQMKGLRLALVPGLSCVRSGIMLVLLLSSLPSLHCDPGSVYYSSYEIVIPKSVTAEGSDAPGEKASYVILMQGQKQLIQLTVKRDYLVTSFPVFSYHGGILRQQMPFLPHDCHYEGYIEGVPGSFVSVNTCSGLRGILVKGATSYGIEPMNSSKRFEHVLYTVARQARVSCSVPSKDTPVGFSSQQQGSRKPGSVQAPSYLWSHTKYVEMFVVVNNQRFQMWGSDVNDTVQRVADIVALANSFTRGINTEVLLAGMEIWTEGDLVEVPVDLQVTLGNFNSWRREKLLRRVKHDVAHMIVGQQAAEGMGQAFLSGACSSGFAAAVETFPQEDVLLSAALMVHELGHNLGIQHDHSACICADRHFCLMHENISRESGFSNCSSHYYHQFLREDRGACLFNNPQHKGRLRRNAVCGNGVVEDGEQCDCGTECQNSPCCDSTCMLTPNAKCSRGPCCRMTCEFELEGVLCRPALGECDLPEYCDGSSAECPIDRYKQDGTPCDRNFYCFHGICGNPDKQCTNNFGFSARSAPDPCYRLINSKGNRFGNCGLPNSSNPEYVKCLDENIFCGKIICTDIRNLPQLKPHYTLIQIPYDNGHCWSMDAYNITDISDDGDVHTGTLCAPNKVCMNYACTDYTVLNYDCNPVVMCNGKGVCNDLKHCHCDAGYAPPDCKTFGHGGSVDSGPPGKQNEDKPNPNKHPNATTSVKHEKILDRMISLLFLLFIILLAIIIICLYINCKSPAAESIEKGPREAAEKPSVIQPEVTASEEAAPEESASEESASEESAPEEAAPAEAAPAEAAPGEMPGEGKEVEGKTEEPEA